MHIWRQIFPSDFPLIRNMLLQTFSEETYYVFRADTPEDEIVDYWFNGLNNQTWLVEEDGVPLGTFYLRSNRAGLGDHIANCGYVVAAEARGRKIGALMAEKSFQLAREHGFKGMQYNFVVASNLQAVNLWKSLGFEIIGTSPAAFHYKRQRYDDAHIMFKRL